MSPRQKEMMEMVFVSFLLMFIGLAAVQRGAAAFAPFPAASFSGRKMHCMTFLQRIATPTSPQVLSDVRQQDMIYQTNLEIGKLASLAPHNATAAIEAQRLLHKLPYADTVTYNGVLKALAKSPSLDGAEEAQELLHQMEQVHKQQAIANQEWYTRMSNMTQETLEQGPPRVTVKPNVRSYSTVMDAWSRRAGKVPNAAQHAQAVLERLETLYKETGDVSYKPNAISYNTVIAALAKDGGQADQAQVLLEKMGPLADLISYNAVLLAWAKSGLPHAGERAEALLRDMTIVNARSYTAVMDAWSKSHAFHGESAERAYALLQEMQELYETTRDVTIRPNCISYSTVINAYALSKDPNKARKAWNLLQRMKQLCDSGENVHVKPSLITYNSVLNACATSPPVLHLQVKQMVQSLYKEIMETPSLQADHFTYGTVLKACANVFCGEEDNDEFVRAVFEQCCNDGQVSFGVCYQLRQAATSELYRQLIPDEAYNPANGHFSMQDMPPQWTRNVRERRTRESMERTKR